jgi:outer membrane immunogenic protein
MIKKLTLAGLAALALSSGASAADLRMPVKAAPMAAPIFSWTGFYIGGFVGGAVGDRDASSTEPQACAGGACVFLFTQPGGVVANNSYSLDASFIGGGTVGYNWQVAGSPWVFGLEGEIGWLDLSRTVRDINAPPPGASPGGFDSTKIGDLYGVIAGRIGYAFDRVLVYGKGGVAFVEKSYGYSAVVPPQTAILTRDDTQTTWAAGAGIEWAFANNWSLKGEYLYIDTHETYNGTGVGVGGFVAGAALTNSHTDPGIHTGKFGLNYRF